MKIKYPIEAFALAFILFSDNMRNALITGIIILLLTILGCVLKQWLNQLEPKWSKPLVMWLLLLAFTFALFQIVFIRILDISITKDIFLLHMMIGVLIAKHITLNEVEEDITPVLQESFIAYCLFIVISFIREFCSFGSAMGYTIADYPFMTQNFQTVIAGFIFAGTGIAFTNFIIKKGLSSLNSFWVILPVILLERPFALDSQNKYISMIVGIVIPVIFLISVQKRLTFSTLSRAFKKLPIELISIGIIYMILDVF
jgi:hypothetical protein